MNNTELTLDQELSLNELEDISGGLCPASMLVGAMFATFVIGAVAAEKAGSPGSFKSSFGGKDKNKKKNKKQEDN